MGVGTSTKIDYRRIFMKRSSEGSKIGFWAMVGVLVWEILIPCKFCAPIDFIGYTHPFFGAKSEFGCSFFPDTPWPLSGPLNPPGCLKRGFAISCVYIDQFGQTFFVS